MSCQLINDYMMQYFDKELNDINKAKMKQHIKTCVKCRTQFNDLSMIFNTLESSESIEPPDDFEAQVMKKIASYKASKKERNSNIAALLYNIAITLAIILLTAFVTNFSSFISFSGVFLSVSETIWDIFRFVSSMFNTFVEINNAFLDEYYQTFAAFLLLLFALQQTLVMIRRNGRGAR